jgi:hypothetical protein
MTIAAFPLVPCSTYNGSIYPITPTSLSQPFISRPLILPLPTHFPYPFLSLAVSHRLSQPAHLQRHPPCSAHLALKQVQAL